jgi:hypothetical protein
MFKPLLIEPNNGGVEFCIIQTMPIRLLAKVPRTWFGRLKVGRQRHVFRGFHFPWFSQAFIA